QVCEQRSLLRIAGGERGAANEPGASAQTTSVSGIGYSSALQTRPGLREKSNRGGPKISISQLSPSLRLRLVWITCAGMTVNDGAPISTCSSSTHCSMFLVHG